MQRYKYLDYMKGWGMLLIICAHCFQGFPIMGICLKYITNYHVPIFFMAAGCLSFHKRTDEFRFHEYVKKRAVQLLIPYIVFSIYNLLSKLTVLLLTGNEVTELQIKNEMIEFLITGNGTVWFLLTLFLVEVAYALFRSKGSNNKYMYVMIMVAVFVLPYYWQARHAIEIVLIRATEAMGYYIYGYLFADICTTHEWKSNKKVYFSVIVSAIVLIMLGLVISIESNGQCYFWGGSFENIIPILSASLFSCTGWILLFMSDINFGVLGNVMDYIGQNSLAYMLIHPTIMLMFAFPLGHILYNLTGIKSVCAALLLYSMVLMLTTPVVWFITKYFKFLLGKKRS